jgi:hypothetical protein
MTGKTKNTVMAILGALMCLTTCTGFAQADDNAWPTGLSFIGLTETSGWRVFIADVDSGQPKIVDTKHQPSSHDYSWAKNVVAYVGIDGGLYLRDLQTDTETVLEPATPNKGYTQPVFSLSGNRLFVVELLDGTSRETNILAYDLTKTPAAKQTFRQRGAQFDPRPIDERWLLYTHVHCVNGCGRIIQEIWERDMSTGEARQLTLNNFRSSEPVPRNRKGFYYVSDAAESVGIQWYERESATSTVVADSADAVETNPVLTRGGRLLFLRRRPGGTTLVSWLAPGQEVDFRLPDFIQDIRNLRCEY